MGASVGSCGATKTDKGLVCGHLFTLLKTVEFGTTTMIQIRNPWGYAEWNGDFADTDTSENAKTFFAEHGHPAKDDGIFWMTLDDFHSNFKNT